MIFSNKGETTTNTMTRFVAGGWLKQTMIMEGAMDSQLCEEVQAVRVCIECVAHAFVLCCLQGIESLSTMVGGFKETIVPASVCWSRLAAAAAWPCLCGCASLVRSHPI